MTSAWERLQGPLAQGLVVLLALLGAWLAGRTLADLRSLQLQRPPLATPMAKGDLADLWLYQHWPSAVADGARLPLTRLPLAWVGALRAVPLSASVVVLALEGRQLNLALGERLPGGAVLTDIDDEGLVLDNGGRLERLPWPAPRPQTSVLSAEEAANRPARADLRGLLDDPSQLSQLVRLTPLLENRHVAGYRLQPGRQSEWFEALGLRPGDVLRSVDHVPVSDLAALAQRREHWRAAASVELGLERAGRPLTLAVELPL